MRRLSSRKIPFRSPAWAAMTSFVVASAAAAQGPPDESRLQLALGVAIGASTDADKPVLGFTSEVLYTEGGWRFGVRYVGLSEFYGSANVQEFALLVGRARERSALSAGLSYLNRDNCVVLDPPIQTPRGVQRTDSCRTIGVPVVWEGSLGTGILGARGQLFANLNLDAPFAGVGASVAVGSR